MRIESAAENSSGVQARQVAPNILKHRSFDT